MLFQSYYRLDNFSFEPPIDSIRPTKIDLGENSCVTFDLKSDEENKYLEIKTTIDKKIDSKIKSCFYPQKTETFKNGKILSSKDGMAGFSNEFIDFTNELKLELSNISTSVLHLLCWKHKIFSSPYKLDTNLFNMRWEDSKNINVGDYLKNQYPAGVYTVSLPNVWIGEFNFEKMVSFKVPLSFELFNEGIIIYNSSPRSSLIIMVASLETAIKQYISSVVPQANWLLENIPSPPITKLYTSYLVTLPSKNPVLDKCIRISKSSIKIIQTAVEIRNKIVHGQNIELSNDIMESIKKITMETIYYIDWLEGENWAFNYLSDEIQEKIKKKER